MTMAKTKDGEWLSVSQIAKALGVNRHTLYGWMRKKRFPYRRVGSRFFAQLEVVRSVLIEDVPAECE
jgi:excisionase family DNA binding protein